MARGATPTPMRWGGRVSIFVDVWDEQGNRIVGVPVRQWWNGGEAFKATEPKTGEPFAVDFVMSAAGNAYGINVADGSPSDQIFGLGLGNRVPHHVFKLIFQRQSGLILPDAPPTEPHDEPLTAVQLLDDAMTLLQALRRML